MVETITSRALSRELGMTQIKNIEARFGPLSLPRTKQRREIVMTRAEADRIRAHYARQPYISPAAHLRYSRPQPVRIAEGPTDAPEYITSLVCRHYGVEPAMLLGKIRDNAVCLARTTLVALLNRHGYNPAAIGRIINRDHSTVLHALCRAHGSRSRSTKHPDTAYAARIMAEVDVLSSRLLCDPDYRQEYATYAPSFDTLLTAATKEHPNGRAVAAYVRAVVRPGRPQPPTMLYHGLVSLARDSALRSRVQTVLARLDQPGLIHIMRHHAEKLGFGWEIAS